MSRQYPTYKDSGVQWLGPVPAHWTVERLKRFAEVLPSNVDKKSHDGETSVALCNYTDVYYNDRIVAGMAFMPATATEGQIERFTLRAGDTIITKDSETADDIAISAYVPEDLPGVVCGYHLAIVRSGPSCVGAFLKRLFDSVYARASFAVRANGLTRMGLGVEEIMTFEVPLPPKDEQVAIAAFLDRETAKIDALVAEQERLIELLKEKRQAVISHAVTKGLNPDAPLKDSGIAWLGLVPAHWSVPPLYTRYDQALGKMLDQAKITGAWLTPYLRNLDVRWDRFNVDDLPLMDIRPEEKDRFTVRKGDLIMVEGRDLGRCAIWDGQSGVVAFQKALHRLRPRDASEHTRYFYYLMVCANAVGAFLADQLPNEIPHLTGEELRRHRLPKPPLEEQMAIVEALDRETHTFDELIAEAERAVALLQERRTALISAAVTGQIDVRASAKRSAA